LINRINNNAIFHLIFEFVCIYTSWVIHVVSLATC